MFSLNGYRRPRSSRGAYGQVPSAQRVPRHRVVAYVDFVSRSLGPWPLGAEARSRGGTAATAACFLNVNRRLRAEFLHLHALAPPPWAARRLDAPRRAGGSRRPRRAGAIAALSAGEGGCVAVAATMIISAQLAHALPPHAANPCFAGRTNRFDVHADDQVLDMQLRSLLNAYVGVVCVFAQIRQFRAGIALESLACFCAAG